MLDATARRNAPRAPDAVSNAARKFIAEPRNEMLFANGWMVFANRKRKDQKLLAFGTWKLTSARISCGDLAAIKLGYKFIAASHPTTQFI